MGFSVVFPRLRQHICLHQHVLLVGSTLLEYVSCHCFVVKSVFKSDGDDCLFSVSDIQSLIRGTKRRKKSNKAEKEFESHFDFVLQQIAHLLKFSNLVLRETDKQGGSFMLISAGLDPLEIMSWNSSLRF